MKEKSIQERGMIPERLEKILMKAQKPSRYIGGELNAVVKPGAGLRIALSYPDLYEVAMSNNGLKILYDRVNEMEDIACERVFAVAPEFEELLRENKLFLYTLETFTPLHKVDLIGFNISHEMLATGMLQVLDLGGIPLFRSKRGEGDPLVIAGGEAVSNPFPLSDFADLFFLGDGEDGIVEIAACLREAKSKGCSRGGTIADLACIDGVLDPAQYQIEYGDAKAQLRKGKKIKKRVYRDKAPADPVRPLVPSMRITQERAVVEVNRGCYNLCKFCHAGYYTLPYRPFEMNAVAKKTLAILKNTGYSELTFASLSVSDYRDLVGLLNTMLPRLNEEGISISLPSLRVDSTTLQIIEMISDVRKSSLTFAVEAASRPLREGINKKVYEEELLDIVEYVFSHGWKVLKLYFMIGLPGSREYDEAASIIELLKKIREKGGRKGDINVTVSPFIPKPHTPFEREEQRDREYLRGIVDRLKKELPRSIKIKNHDLNLSLLEGVFTRGDARLGEVVAEAYRRGCRLDSWREYFMPRTWFEVLDEKAPWWDEYLRERSEGTLPWECVETGFEKLKEGWRHRCIDLGNFSGPAWRYRDELDTDAIKKGLEKFTGRYEVISLLRINFCKTGRARYLSHLDFLEVVRRGLRMAGIPVAFSQGFNKRERIAAGFPVPLGIESESEIIDVDLYAPVDDGMLARLEQVFPEGISVTGTVTLDSKTPLMSEIRGLRYRIDGETSPLEKLVSLCIDKPSFIKKTKKGEREITFDDAVMAWERGEDAAGAALFFDMKADSTGTLRIDLFLSELAEKGGLAMDEFGITKVGQFIQTDDGLELI